MRISLAPTPTLPTPALIATAVSQIEIDLAAGYPAGIPFAATFNFEWSANGTTGWTSLAIQKSPQFADTSLSPSTTRFYRVRVQLDSSRITAYSNVASATTNPPTVVVLGAINFDPGFYGVCGNLGSYNGFSDPSKGWQPHLAKMLALDTSRYLKGAFVTFGFGQCEGNFGDYSAWFTSIDQLLSYTQSIGLHLGICINVTGNVGSASVPSYMRSNATYGQVVSGTGYQGGLFSGPSAGVNTGNVATLRYDIPATAARIAAAVTALYNNYGTDIYAVCPTWSEIQDMSSYVPQMTDNAMVASFCSSGGMFDQLRAGAPKTYLMFSPSYIGTDQMPAMFAATDRAKIACGAYDFMNPLAVRSGGASRNIPAETGFTGQQIVSGAYQPVAGLIDRRAHAGGRDFWGHIGPDELGQNGTNSDGTSKAGNVVPPTRLGDGDLLNAIWPNVQFMQNSHVLIYGNQQTGPRCNSIGPLGYTPAANYASATWANLIDFFKGRTVPATTYPAAWL